LNFKKVQVSINPEVVNSLKDKLICEERRYEYCYAASLLTTPYFAVI